MATINDIVLIYLEDTPISFARVEDIRPDRKKDWYQIKLLMLQIPLQVVTWILKDLYINGDDFFMNGKKMRLETVKCPEEEIPDFEDELPEPPGKGGKSPKEGNTRQGDAPQAGTRKESGGKIIAFTDLKKNKTEPEPDIG